jgi:tetratricopeptide (TPR) repeat protein
MKPDRRIQEIQKLSNVQSEEGKIRESVLTYRQLQFLYPQEKEFYVTYIQYLEEESVIAELLWNAYEESLACCDRAIVNLPVEDSFYFCQKKLELLILMIDNDYSWYESHKEGIQNYIRKLLQNYPNNAEILKRLMALYRVTGNYEEEQKLLDKAYQVNPNDFTLLIQRVMKYEKNEDYKMAIEILEKYIKGSNPISFYMEIVYKKLIDLYTRLNNPERADYYENLLDNL